MLILQIPVGLVFEKNIPDIVLQRENDEVGVDIALKVDGVTVIDEHYVYDTDGIVTVRRLDEVVSAYFAPVKTVVDGLIHTTGLVLGVALTIDAGADHAFTVLKCEADMPAAVLATNFIAQNFLTRLPYEKRTATNRNEYLSYLHLQNYSEVFIRYKVHYRVGELISFKEGVLHRVNLSGQAAVVTFNASPATIRVAAALPTQYIDYYELWFTEDIIPIDSKSYAMSVVDVYLRDKRNFVFENSFGCLETFTATGRSETKKTVEVNLANIQNRYRKTSQDFKSETSQNTGWLNEEEMEWLDDILLSYHVATYTPGVSGVTEEITIISSDKVDSTNNEMHQFSFSYRRARNNHLQFADAARGIFDMTFDPTFN